MSGVPSTRSISCTKARPHSWFLQDVSLSLSMVDDVVEFTCCEAV